MKKLFLILTFSSGIAISAQAQTDFQTKAVFGLKAGVNLSNVYDDTNEQFVSDPKMGFVAGGFLTLPIGKFFAIQPEILFAQRGFHSTNSTLGINYENTRTTEYIDIPVLLSIRPSKYVSILFGPQLSYLLKQSDKFSSNLGNTGSEEVFSNNNVRKNTVCFTGGIEVPLEHLVISARAGWDIKDNNGDGTTSSIRYKDMWYQATLGYRF